MRSLGIVALIVLSVSLLTPQALAEPALVVLVRPPARSAIVDEAITRIRGELVADGFDVTIVDAPPGADPGSVLARADHPTNATATLGLFLHADAKVAEVWVVDRLTQKTVTRSIAMPRTPADSAPEVLARRSVELLRASLLEILVDVREGAAQTTEARERASSWAAQALSPRPSRWGVEGGAQVLAGFRGVDAAVMPLARVRLAVHERLAARLSLSGLGTQPRVEAPAGSATVSQELGLVELVAALGADGWLEPSLSLGAGAYHVGVDGSANWPYAGSSDDRFVFAGDAGLGLALALTPSLSLSLEGHGMLLAPYPVVRFLGTDTAQVGNPVVAATLTLAGRL